MIFGATRSTTQSRESVLFCFFYLKKPFLDFVDVRFRGQSVSPDCRNILNVTLIN